MGSTAVQIVTEAYRRHNLSEVTTFSTALAFPYNVALNLLNDVLRKMNRLGNLYWTETKTALTYSGGVYTYSFKTLVVDPVRIITIRREAANFYGELDVMNYRDFQRAYRMAATATATPTVWSRFGDTLELSTIPDQDYTLYVYHYKDMPVIATTADTFLIPERDEDVLIDNCYQLLGAEIGKWDKPTAMSIIAANTAPFLAKTENDAAIGQQMPAAF